MGVAAHQSRTRLSSNSIKEAQTADVVKRAEDNAGQLKPEQCIAVLGGGNESKADRAEEEDDEKIEW